ncbi:hypothetical protein D7X96_08395 [Corallococcus interemptor]|uniref:Uncharacterized protein n=1 Tax=Corallococcus interemptor TaxID=2316720 RepID=A0A3A8QYH4_9BACT|nr:hypothetical protein [Corallococcus interemptor]RKH71515.1 hypothetical protein D7X96_08395 [Corallococcus interemptor]
MDAIKRAVYLGLLTGCATSTGTVVEGSLQPRHFKFVTIVEHTGPGAGGWRAACVRVPLRRDSGEVFMCQLGVEVPMQTAKEGPIPIALAQRISSDCANLAAQTVFSAATPVTALGLACEDFRNTFTLALNGAIGGSKVSRDCRKETTPVSPGGKTP